MGWQRAKQVFVGPIVPHAEDELWRGGTEPFQGGSAFVYAGVPNLDHLVLLQDLDVDIARGPGQIIQQLPRAKGRLFGIRFSIMPGQGGFLFFEQSAGETIQYNCRMGRTRVFQSRSAVFSKRQGSRWLRSHMSCSAMSEGGSEPNQFSRSARGRPLTIATRLAGWRQRR